MTLILMVILNLFKFQFYNKENYLNEKEKETIQTRNINGNTFLDSKGDDGKDKGDFKNVKYYHFPIMSQGNY
jgi:hypothetical protein